MFENATGDRSELRIPSAKLIEYTDDSLTVYAPGKRPLTPAEKAEMEQWQRKQDEYEGRPLCGNMFYLRKRFFLDCPFPYLFGDTFVSGKKYDYSSQTVIDRSNRGEVELQYRLYRDGPDVYIEDSTASTIKSKAQ